MPQATVIWQIAKPGYWICKYIMYARSNIPAQITVMMLDSFLWVFIAASLIAASFKLKAAR